MIYADHISMAKHQASVLDKRWRAERKASRSSSGWRLTRAYRNAAHAAIIYWEARQKIVALETEIDQLKEKLASLQ
jgi:hypothetical protein